MRTGISLTVSSLDRHRLRALIKDRNAPQKHVWRAEIILLSGIGVGTVEIMRQTGKSKTCVWRWQETATAHPEHSLNRSVECFGSVTFWWSKALGVAFRRLFLSGPLRRGTVQNWTFRPDPSDKIGCRSWRAG